MGINKSGLIPQINMESFNYKEENGMEIEDVD